MAFIEVIVSIQITLILEIRLTFLSKLIFPTLHREDQVDRFIELYLDSNYDLRGSKSKAI
jgi:hypothetical protein